MRIPSTMPEQVDQAKSLELSYRTLHQSAILVDKDSNRKIKIPLTSITNKYRDYLSTIIKTKELTDEQQDFYMFKPKALSQLFYNTTEFWNDLLILNGCSSVTQFKPKVVKYYDPSKFKLLLNEIIILENEIK